MHEESSPDPEDAMTQAPDTAIREAAGIIEDYFASPTRSLIEWVGPFAERVAEAHRTGTLTTGRIDALVEPHALHTLGIADAPVYGAGFIAAIDLPADARSHLAWWQGEDRKQLVLAAQSLNKEDIDYSALEWYRIPMATGRPHMAGPYVDYLCSDEYTITIAVPAEIDGERIGVAGLDMLVSEVERDLLPRFEALDREVTVTNSIGRILLSTDPSCATGDAVRSSRWAEFPRFPCTSVGLDVIVDAPRK